MLSSRVRSTLSGCSHKVGKMDFFAHLWSRFSRAVGAFECSTWTPGNSGDGLTSQDVSARQHFGRIVWGALLPGHWAGKCAMEDKLLAKREIYCQLRTCLEFMLLLPHHLRCQLEQGWQGDRTSCHTHQQRTFIRLQAQKTTPVTSFTAKFASAKS